MENVILAPVKGLSQGRQALQVLRDLADEGVVTVRGAAIVERRPDGGWYMPEETEDLSYEGIISGGLVGGLIGLLIGPAGLLIGATAGAAVGTAAERHDVGDIERLLRRMARAVPPATTALIADLDEPSPTAVDAVLAPYTVGVDRLARAEVEARLSEEPR